MVTLAPLTTAPEGSVTVPTILPVLIVVCARRGEIASSVIVMQTAIAAHHFLAFVIVDLPFSLRLDVSELLTPEFWEDTHQKTAFVWVRRPPRPAKGMIK